MPRPVKERYVSRPPLYTDFKPGGIPGSNLKKLMLGLDEYEALRLADYLGMEHSEAALEMEISRPTFTRLVEKARQKISQFLVEGRHLLIEGGQIHFRGNLIKCLDCGRMFNTRLGEDFSTCPSCGSSNLVDLAGGFGHGECCIDSLKEKKDS